MTRKIGKKKLASLKKLTKIRRIVYSTELLVVENRVHENEKAISRLITPIKHDNSFSQIKNLAQYLLWREKELIQLKGDQAALRADYESVQQKVGITVAEDETAGHLNEQFELSRRRQKNRREEHSASSHFLTYNVSDKDI